MKKETAFWREDHVKEALKKLHEKLEESAVTVGRFMMEKEFDKIVILLVYLCLDLEVNPYIKNKYISKMKDGYAKKTALTAFQIATEIGKAPSAPQL